MKNQFQLLFFVFLFSAFFIFFEKELRASREIDDCPLSSSKGRYANTNNPKEIAQCFSQPSQCKAGQREAVVENVGNVGDVEEAIEEDMR